MLHRVGCSASTQIARNSERSWALVESMFCPLPAAEDRFETCGGEIESTLVLRVIRKSPRIVNSVILGKWIWEMQKLFNLRRSWVTKIEFSRASSTAGEIPLAVNHSLGCFTRIPEDFLISPILKVWECAQSLHISGSKFMDLDYKNQDSANLEHSRRNPPRS